MVFEWWGCSRRGFMGTRSIDLTRIQKKLSMNTWILSLNMRQIWDPNYLYYGELITWDSWTALLPSQEHNLSALKTDRYTHRLRGCLGDSCTHGALRPRRPGQFVRRPRALDVSETLGREELTAVKTNKIQENFGKKLPVFVTEKMHWEKRQISLWVLWAFVW